MTQKEKAISLVDTYRNILMNEDTECGNEILCTLIAMKCAIIAVDEIIDLVKHIDVDSEDYWNEVKHEIEKL
jgi:hypothetical protein